MIALRAQGQSKITIARSRKGAGAKNSTVLVVGIYPSGDTVKIAATRAEFDHSFVKQALAALGAKGQLGQVERIFLPSGALLIATGLGDAGERLSKGQGDEFDLEVLRQASANALRNCGNDQLHFDLPHGDSYAFAAIAEGIAFAAYAFDDFRNSQSNLATEASILTGLTPAQTKKVINRTEILAQAIHHTRDLVNTPPNHLTPAIFAQSQGERAKALGLKVSIMDEKALLAKGFGGIIGVGQGSVNPPRLLKISYEPENAAALKKRGEYARIALVGKGITFDTGGLALKPASGMDEMKSDMSGAAAVIQVAIAASLLNLPIAIDAYAALAENMPSDTATRPSDILRIYGGKTVEVLNPDAEGRLVLADALVYAQEVANSTGLTALIDVATLTGAQGIALGKRVSATMTNDHELSLAFHDAADAAGELFWPMPLPQELRPSLDSPVADLANIGERQGGMLVAGLFLREFVAEQTPWLHLDIASPAFNDKSAYGYTPVGGTGVAVASLLTFLERL
jgi:leucyl aminopeptidase